ncbi:MAG: NCS2 family permease [Pirellulales bacterium]|nr:NCS2 family permease [Pirellulales bacterium]
MLDRFFELSKRGTNVRTELLAGLTTFLTMAYIVFVQPGVLSGKMFGIETGLDFGAVTTATCVAAALATVIMGLYANYPIGQAPGMGENFFFLSVIVAADTMIKSKVSDGTMQPGETTAWQIALGVVFISGVLFVLVSLLGVREVLLNAVSRSMRNGIAIGIGLFIAFIGLKNASLILPDDQLAVKLNTHFASLDLAVFFFGILFTAGLYARKVRGSIVWGILAATSLAVLMKVGLPYMPEEISKADIVVHSRLMSDTGLQIADRVVSTPPSMAPTFLKMDLIGALSWTMCPFILIFLFMDLFDTLGTLIGVSEQANLIEDDKLPRARQAMMSDALGTAAGAAMGTSTVTSFIESASGVEQGGRTGLTAVTVAVLFLLTLFFSPIIAMIGSYAPITAPALVVVGSLMMRNVTKIDWSDYTESMPSFLIIIGIPLTFSISDGLALGFIAYPIIKIFAGRGGEVKWLMYVIALILVCYFLFVRMQVS